MSFVGAFAGVQSKFHYIVEDYLGAPLPTPEPPATFTMYGLTPDDIEPSFDTALIKVRGCGSRDLTALKRGLLKADLKVVYAVPSDDIMSFLHHVVDCFALTCEVTDSDEAGTSIVDVLYTGSRIDKATVSCSLEDVLRAECDLIAQDVNASDALIAGAAWSELAGAVAFSDTLVSKGAADGSNPVPFEVVTDWKFTIANNLKRVGVIRVTDPTILKYLVPRHRELSGELTCTFENKDQYYEAAAGTFGLKFDLSAGKFFTFKNCQWSNVGSVRRPEDLVSLKLAFTAESMVDSEVS